MYPFIVLDVETGGLDPNNDALLSIGMQSLKTGNSLYLEIFPPYYLNINDRALEFNGFTRGDIYNSKNIPETKAVEHINKFIENEPRVIAGHNPRFDLNFLKSLYNRCHTKFPFSYRTIDTHTLMIAKLVSKDLYKENLKIDLDFVLDYFGLARKFKYHNAMEDALLTSLALTQLLN